MKKTLIILVCLVSVTISKAQDMSPKAILEVLMINKSLDNIFYDNFILKYGQPHEEINGENDVKTFKYEFVNKKRNLKIELSFITNSYGKIVSILYHFPEEAKELIIEDLNKKLSIINSKAWFNSTHKNFYGLVKLSDIEATSDSGDLEFLFISNQM